VLHAGLDSGGDRGVNLVSVETRGQPCLPQFLLHRGSIEVPVWNQLAQAEGRAIQLIVARALWGAGDGITLALKRRLGVFVVISVELLPRPLWAW
jgi:hypothetical protein